MHHDGWHGVVDSDQRWILGMQQVSTGIRYWFEHDDDHHRLRDFALIPEQSTVSGVLQNQSLRSLVKDMVRNRDGVASNDNVVDQSERVTMLRTTDLAFGKWHSIFTFRGSSVDRARIHTLASSPEVTEIQRRLGVDIESHYDVRPAMGPDEDDWRRRMQEFAQGLESHADP